MMGKLGKWFLSEEETQEKSYGKFKNFWKGLWRGITFQWIWNRKSKKENII